MKLLFYLYGTVGFNIFLDKNFLKIQIDLTQDYQSLNRNLNSRIRLSKLASGIWVFVVVFGGDTNHLYKSVDFFWELVYWVKRYEQNSAEFWRLYHLEGTQRFYFYPIMQLSLRNDRFEKDFFLIIMLCWAPWGRDRANELSRSRCCWSSPARPTKLVVLGRCRCPLYRTSLRASKPS